MSDAADPQPPTPSSSPSSAPSSPPSVPSSPPSSVAAPLLQPVLARFPVLLTLRWRLSLALLASVAVAVASGTVAHLVEVSDRLERDLQAQATRVTGAIRTDLEATATALDEELVVAADPRAGVSRLLGSGRVETRFLGAQARLVSGRLEVLKVLLKDGTILTSGHWPASFGALDPLIAAYAQDPGRLPRIVDEATPEGSAPALERWLTMRASGREIVVVAGRFLDAPALERLRARTGADLLALCTTSPTSSTSSSSYPGLSLRGRASSEDCLTARTPELLAGRVFSPTDRTFVDRLRLDVIDVGGLSLYVGLDRSGIERVRSGIIGRAVFVGFMSVIFAVILGALVARRVVRPIEDLAEAAARVARGDLSARVKDPQTGGEVQALVDAFNLMARDLEGGQRRLLQAERVAAWQEIARGLAHELKNPLTPILSAMDVIRRARQLGRADFDAILQEQASAVVEEVMRLKELADAFARFARLPEKRPEPLPVEELIDHALALYASGIPVERTIAADLPPLLADRTQLLTVLTNLVKNAVEAMDTTPEADRRLGVSVTVEHVASDAGEDDDDGASTDVMVIAIDDAGPGIAKDVVDRLFTPYVTTKGSRGTGLGLALAHRIIIEHQGSIEASTSPLGGARFTLRIPLTASGPPPVG
jgi:two-component system nitrogen regulation sensor histidine kinase NtrY